MIPGSSLTFAPPAVALALLMTSINAAAASTAHVDTAVSVRASTVVAVAQDLGTLGGEYSSASAVDGDIVVGYSQVAGGGHAFAVDLRAVTPTMLDLGTLGGRYSSATDVSGSIVVGTSDIPGGRDHYFVYDLDAATPGMVDLGFGPDPSGTYGDPGPFVDGNLIVGQMEGGRGEPHAFAYDLAAPASSPIDLGTLGGSRSYATAVDGQVVVGASSLRRDESLHAFAYDLGANDSEMLDLDPLGRDSEATAISGTVVVGRVDTRAGVRAFVYDTAAAEPSLRSLGTLGGGDSSAWAIDGGVVVGSSEGPSGAKSPFAVDLGAVSPNMIDLGSLGGRSGYAEAVDRDVVVGSSQTTVGERAFAYDLGATSAGMIDLGGLGGRSSSAIAVSGGVIAGRSETSAGTDHATVWSLVDTDRPVLQFTGMSQEVDEGTPTATVTVTRLGDPDPVVTVEYAAHRADGGGATPGTDFTAVAGTLSFATGVTEQSFSVPIADDDMPETTETIAVSLTQPSGGAVLGTPQVAGVRILASDFRPDALVRTAVDQRFYGEDVFNTTATGQTRRLSARRTQTSVFYVRVCNDIAAPTRRRIAGTFTLRANQPVQGSSVRYYRRDAEVTEAIRSSTGLPVRVRLDRCVEFSVRIRVGAAAAIGSTHRGVVTATWSGDVVNTDRVRSVVRVVR